jgi:hypothetical protein
MLLNLLCCMLSSTVNPLKLLPPPMLERRGSLRRQLADHPIGGANRIYTRHRKILILISSLTEACL